MSANNIWDFVSNSSIKYLVQPIPILVTVAVFAAALYYISSSQRRSKYPPGPHGFPIIGHLPSLLDDMPHYLLDKLSKQFGDIFSITIAGRLYVVLSSYEAIRSAYVLDGSNFSYRPQGFTIFAKFFEFKAMAFVGGEEWKIHRKILSSWLKAGNSQAKLEEGVADTARGVVQKIQSLVGEPVDLYPIFANAAMDVVSSLVCGERLPITQPDVASSILRDTRKVFELSPAGEVVVGGGISNLIFHPFSKKCREISQLQERQFKIMNRFIQEHMEELDPNNPKDYIDAFLSARNDATEKGQNPDWFNQEILVVNMLIFYAAGIDTTSSALYFATLLMAKHPEIQARCQQELDTNIGRGTLDFADRKRLPYVEATLNEVLRYAGIAATPQPRTNYAKTNLLGFEIPANTTFITNLWTATRDPKYFQNPTKFDPDNFYEKEIPRELISLPFSAGKRNCPGEQLAKLELFMIFASIIREFTITFPTDDAAEYGTEKLQPGFNKLLAPFKIIATPR